MAVWVNTLDEFLLALKEHEQKTCTKYCVYKSPKSFSEKSKISPKMRVRWLNDIPYIHISSKTYICHQGKDINAYQKIKYAKQKDKKLQEDNGLVRKSGYASKKLGCGASFSVIRAYRMPTKSDLDATTKYEKSLVSKEIRTKLENNDLEEMYCYTFPTETDHSHPLEVFKPKHKPKKRKPKKREDPKKSDVTEMCKIFTDYNNEDVNNCIARYEETNTFVLGNIINSTVPPPSCSFAVKSVEVLPAAYDIEKERQINLENLRYECCSHLREMESMMYSLPLEALSSFANSLRNLKKDFMCSMPVENGQRIVTQWNNNNLNHNMGKPMRP